MKSPRARAILAAALPILAGAARPAHAADVILPPTLVLDFLYLGFPLAIFAGLGLAAGMVIAYRRLRGRGRGRAFSATVGAGVFFAGNLAIYLIWLNFLREPPGRRQELLLPPPTSPPSTTTSPSAAPASAPSAEP